MDLTPNRIRILVVDDTLPMRSIITYALSGLGIKDFYTANNAHTGFRAFCKHKPDIVISDWIMSGGSGIELTHLIRKSPVSTNRIAPIIMISGFSAPTRVAQARDAGVTEFLVKPFTVEQLAQRIAHVINNPRSFIDFSEYFGPDRRRKKYSNYFGPYRREEDKNRVYVG